MTYEKIENVRFVKLENFNFDNNVKIYHNNEEINYRIITANTNTMVINLITEYMADNLTFYIPNAKNYKIVLYKDEYLKNIILSKNVENEELLIPDKTWIPENTNYVYYYTTEKLRETDFTKKIYQTQICRVREIQVYKYKITKEYYDDNYYINVDGYKKDINNYKIFYEEQQIINTIEKPITNIVEITKEKIVKEPKIEYIYIPIENEIQKIDSSEKTECTPQIKTEIKTIEKEIYRVPKKIYIIIGILMIVVFSLLLKLRKKHVD